MTHVVKMALAIIAPIALSIPCYGQSVRVYQIAEVHPGPPEASEHFIQAFRQGLQDLGYVDGQNIKIQLRSRES